MTFMDRTQAGRELADRLSARRWAQPPVVLALAPSAVPLAFEVARALHAELDLWEVRPFFAPGRPDRELGVVASGGVRVVHRGVQAALGIDDDDLPACVAPVSAEIHRRERNWRRRHPRTSLSGATVVWVADVVGPDTRLDAAALVARACGAAHVIAAVGTGLPAALARARADADELIVLAEAPDAAALSGHFAPPPGDTEVVALLERAEEWRAPVPAG